MIGGNAQATRLWPVLAILVFSLSSCAGSNSPAVAPVGPAVRHKQLDVGGVSRTYRLYTPPSLDRTHPAPLVIVLGGYGNSADDMVGATGFDRVAETGNFVVAYADGSTRRGTPATAA